MGANNAKFGEMKDNLYNNYLLRDDQYPKNREVLVVLINNCTGSKNQQTTTNTTTMQDEVVFIQKDADSNDKKGKRVNVAGKEQCYHSGNSYGHWIN